MTGTGDRLDEFERDWAHVIATGGAVELDRCGTCSAAFAAVSGLVERLRDAQAEIKRVQFQPLGDNHHNAGVCPYCTATVANERDALAARLAEAEAWREANNEQAQRLVEHRNELMAQLAAVRTVLDSDEVDGPEHDDWVWLDEANRKLTAIRAALDAGTVTE